MINVNDDGITHINIYSKGKTEIGRFLSNFTLHPFKCEDGKFESIEGYWYWLLTGDERLRKMHGYEAKQLGKELNGQIDFRYFEEFKAKILNAIEIKLKSKKKELKQTTLPFMHYYVYGDKAVDAGYEWIVEFIQEYRGSL